MNPGTDESHTATASPSPGEAIQKLRLQMEELQAQYSRYVTARARQIRLYAKRIVFRAVLGFLGAVIVITLLITGTTMVVEGAAMGLSEALPEHPWIGRLVVGAGIFILFALAFRILRASLLAPKKSETSVPAANRQAKEEHARDR